MATGDVREDVTRLMQRAEAALRMNDYASAASAAYAALATVPDHEYAMRLYTLALHGQHRIADAFAVAWTMVTRHPRSHLAQHIYAGLLHEAGRPREALTVVDEALRLQPAAPDSMVLRGDVYLTLWGAEAASMQYLNALRLQPDHPVAMHNLAVGRLRWGSLGEAVRGLLAAGRLSPALMPLVRDNVGMALLRVLRMATACTVFLAVALIVVSAAREDTFSSVLPRMVAAILSLALAGAVVWIVVTIPPPMVLAAFRTRWLLAVRMCFMVFAVVAGLTTAAIGSSPLTDGAGGLLVLGVIGLNVLGWVTGG